MKTPKRIMTLGTIYKFCADYHSGQWSRGYRLLSRIGISLSRDGFERPIDQIQLNENIYRTLVAKYGDKM